MSIPPFPSQDLAKLVLGYLAEEQLMTAYDEFLQASPYLDALGNEYDRIFMTSLKNILAEYRAVKIYVETCKPIALRRKIFQCTNLLEIVKFLIQYVDVNKLQTQEGNLNKVSAEKQSMVTSLKSHPCDVCNSLKLDSCTCKTKDISVSSTLSTTQISTSSVENSVETTSLSDLPGNHVTCRKKSPRPLNKDLSLINLTNEQTNSRLKLPTNNEVVEKSPSMSQKIQDASENSSTLGTEDTLENRQKEEFYNILNQVCKKNETISNTNPVVNPNVDVERGVVEGTTGYKEFATGVTGGEGVNIVPDSSTSENLHVHVPATKETHTSVNSEQNEKMQQTITQYLLKSKNNSGLEIKEIVSINTVSNLPKIKPKTDESKIKILSDIKVDSNESLGATANIANVPLKQKNATSTPLLQMQTILINGTPVYKHQHLGISKNYTKDEIMAMPTIILAPAPDRTVVRSQSKDADPIPQIPIKSSSARTLGPLIIDVTSDNTGYLNQINSNNPDTLPAKVLNEVKESNVSKIVDLTSASAPKDNTVTSNIETSTPQGLPPLRKSSSTPRRTSHVRVLDFTTPRRILHETINECVPNMADSNDVEVIISKSPNLSFPVTPDKCVGGEKAENISVGLKENSVKPKTSRKSNWDSELRKHALASESKTVNDVPKLKPKPRSTKKRKSSKSVPDNNANDTAQDKCDAKKKTPKSKPKRKCSVEPISEVITIPDEKDVPVKPTINIIPGDIADIAKDRVPSSSEKNNKGQNKSNSDENIDTPEMERMSLQNEIGAKLNISDLLETPYKQALYDIQMETPRFLGPDIPDDPLSDIKIMNIPTPRFLTTATPSSYSSRPTDYSSGGSYYKPDDQDYMRIQDDTDCIVSSTKQNTTNNLSNKDDSDSKEKENLKPSRPVRECTRNVSYKRGKPKHVANKEDSDSSSADSVMLADLVTEKDAPKKIDNKAKPSKNKPLAVKKGKSPIKKDKSFMKIKPRRPTPTKKDGRGRKKMSDPSNVSNVQTRKKVANKEGKVTPVVTCAPTKSRRKSSTPRKLHCSKSFHSESSGHDSPDIVSKSKEKIPEPSVAIPDSDTEQLPLRWSDDGSQEPKPVVVNIPIDSEDINKIKDYIDTAVISNTKENEGSLHIDLVKRGFDIETAKSIERDLLDSTPEPLMSTVNLSYSSKAVETIVVVENKSENSVLEKTAESECSSNNLQIVQNDEEEDDEEIEFSVNECNEESANYISCIYDDTKDTSNTELTKLKDKFCMEVCIDDGVSIRLRATPFSLMLDQDPQPVEFLDYSYRETELAVSSISNFNKLYTPLKDSMKAQCYEIFDSTLTSLDTPLKVSSPRNEQTEVTVTEIILEVEKVDVKEKAESKKRKRVHSGNVSDEGSVENKKSKPESQYNLFSSANIQNIDIESVLSKLHGP